MQIRIPKCEEIQTSGHTPIRLFYATPESLSATTAPILECENKRQVSEPLKPLVPT